MYLSPYYDLPTQEAFRYHFRPTRPAKPSWQPEETDTHKDLRLGLGALTDRQQLIKPWTKDPSGPMSERAELDYRMAPDIVRKDAPFGNIYTPNITVKIIGGRSVPVIETYPAGTETYGNRLQTLQPITEKPNHLDPRTFGDNPKGYYNSNVQPTATVNKRPDSKNITRAHYKALPPIQANRTKNDMSTVFEAEAWTGNQNPNLAKETEYKTNFYTDFQPHNDMDQQRSTNQRPSRDHLYVSKEEEQQLSRLLPSSVLLPTDPIDFGRMQPVLLRLIASEMGEGSSAALKDVYLEVCRHDKDLRSFCAFEILANLLANHQFNIPHLRLVAAQYVDPQQPGKVNYEEIIKFLGNALKFRDRGEIPQDSRINTPRKHVDEMADEDTPRSSDRPKYYMSNGESGIRTGSLYKDREVAKLLRTVEAALSTYSMDWTKYRSAFNKMDRDHRDTLSASQIKDICYDFRLPLSESLMDQILALCEDNNRDGQYRWEDFLDFIGKVRPMNTGLPMPVSKRPLEYVRHIPEPVPNWPKMEGYTSPERHSPRRDGSPVRGGYTDRPPVSPIKREAQISETAPDISADRIKSPERPPKTPARQSRPTERHDQQKHVGGDRHSHPPDRRLRSPYKSPDRYQEQHYGSSPSPLEHVPQGYVEDSTRVYSRNHGQLRSNNYQRECQSPERYGSNEYKDSRHAFRTGEGSFYRRESREWSYRDGQRGYTPSWYPENQPKIAASPVPARRVNERERHDKDQMRYLKGDSYDNYMNTWAQKQMRVWPDNRYSRPKSYAEPQRHQPAVQQVRQRPLSYHDNRVNDQPGRRNRSLSPIRQGSPVRDLQYPGTHRESYRDLYAQQQTQYPVYSHESLSPTRFDGPPGENTGRGGGGGDYGYSHRDGYGYDDNPRRGQYRFDDQQQRGSRELQIKQLSEELRDLETKYNITQEAMKSHEKPWPDRYIKMTEALYNSDVSNKGCLPWKDVEEIVRLYNDSFNLNLDMTYAELVARNNTDRSGNVMLRPFLLNLSSEGRLTSGRRSRGRLY